MATLTTNLIHQQTHHFQRRNMDSSIESSMDSNDVASNYDRESLNIDDNNSCCSDDTVLSVGNENPPVVVVQNESLSFKNIESHLNAISKITNSTLDPDRKSPSSSSPLNHRLTNNSPLSIKSTTDSMGGYYGGEKSNPTSPTSFRQNNLCSPLSPNRLYTSGSESPESTNNRISPKPQHAQETTSSTTTQNFYSFQQNGTKSSNVNNDAQISGNLKFSIDNILKADFGRRITEPINIRKSKPKKVVPEKLLHNEDSFKSTITTSLTTTTATTTTTTTNIGSGGGGGGGGAGGGPVDLSKNDDKNGKTDNPSNQPMLWPAWVYCTRYSDRPSSGKL